MIPNHSNTIYRSPCKFSTSAVNSPYSLLSSAKLQIIDFKLVSSKLFKKMLRRRYASNSYINSLQSWPKKSVNSVDLKANILLTLDVHDLRHKLVTW